MLRRKATTVGAFEEALDQALKTRGTFHIIEVVMDKLDFSNAGKRFSEVAKKLVSKSLN